MAICNRWTGYLKESSDIIKPAVQAGRHSSITWTVEDDAATILSMIKGGSSYAKIASELGNGFWPKTGGLDIWRTRSVK
jgi:hypothetical protein